MRKPNPICVACGLEMRVEKNGYVVHNEFLCWCGDLYRCPECDARVVSGFGTPAPYDEEQYRDAACFEEL